MKKLRAGLSESLCVNLDDSGDGDWPLPSPRWLSVYIGKWYTLVEAELAHKRKEGAGQGPPTSPAAPVASGMSIEELRGCDERTLQGLLERIQEFVEWYYSCVEDLACRAIAPDVDETTLRRCWDKLQKSFTADFAKFRKAWKGVGRTGPPARPRGNWLLLAQRRLLRDLLKKAVAAAERENRKGSCLDSVVAESVKDIQESLLEFLGGWADDVVPEFTPRPAGAGLEGQGCSVDRDGSPRDGDDLAALTCFSDLGVDIDASTLYRVERRFAKYAAPLVELLIPALLPLSEAQQKAMDKLAMSASAIAADLRNSQGSSGFDVAAMGILARVYDITNVLRVRRMMRKAKASTSSTSSSAPSTKRAPRSKGRMVDKTTSVRGSRQKTKVRVKAKAKAKTKP